MKLINNKLILKFKFKNSLITLNIIIMSTAKKHLHDYEDYKNSK